LPQEALDGVCYYGFKIPGGEIIFDEEKCSYCRRELQLLCMMTPSPWAPKALGHKLLKAAVTSWGSTITCFHTPLLPVTGDRRTLIGPDKTVCHGRPWSDPI